ncbi:SDR family oxidoreductase [Pikeienuella sp. HZG-20]|uniref:SDR family oxidoreductase n=1 Tax=Paludibacillus litoralis TaxID=3133267 RepID=UPI0030EC0898
MDLGISGKHALLMASTRGLGFAIARALVKEGVNVFISGRNESRVKSSLAELNALGSARAAGLCCDLDVPDSGDELVAAAMDAFGSIDIVVLNSGGPPMGGAVEIEEHAWRSHFESMVLTPMRIVRRSLPGMRERGWGRVIAITSSGVPQPIPEMALSNSLRAALTNWLKTTSNEVAANGVTVNTLIPGRIATDRVAELETAAAKRANLSVEEIHRQEIATVPSGREGETEEFAAAALFLASRQGGYCTGGAIRVDGGMIRSTMS